MRNYYIDMVIIRVAGKDSAGDGDNKGSILVKLLQYYSTKGT